MKPRNKFEQAVLAQSKHLRPITKAQRQWAFRECIEHYAYRLPKGNTTCMDCGHSWQLDAPTKHCTCPQCGAGLQVATTRARKLQQKHYFTVLTTSGGYQVLRMYLLIVGMEKGYQAVPSVIEIGQYWWSESGRQTIVAIQRKLWGGMWIALPTIRLWLSAEITKPINALPIAPYIRRLRQ